MKKSFTKILTLVLSLLVVVALAACGKKTQAPTSSTEAPVNYQAMLDNYLLDIDGKTVSKDFVLPKTISANDKTYEIAWESNNEAVVIEAKEDEYLAKVTYPDQTTTVTLTLHLSNLTKSFSVIVEGLEPTTFSKNYQFPKDKATVTQDFNLDQEMTIQGKKATITWSVDEAYQAYIEVSQDGTKCIVHQSSLNPEVMIKATFTYNGKTTSKNYRFTVSKEVSELESIDAWYYNIGSSITVSGYVVAVGTAYSEQYGNVTLYVVNEDLTAGFYLYRVKADKENGAKLAAGKYVTVTGALSTNYGGLRESSSTGTVVVDESKPTKDVSEMFYAVDEDLLGNVPAALYSQSRPVSLTGWEVTEVTKEHASASPTVVLKVKKGGVTLSVLYSKYVEECYNYTKGDQDPVVAAILAKVANINVGDYVNIKGILGANNNLPQITLMSADGIEAGTAEAEGTTHPGVLVGATITKVQNEIKTNDLLGLITSQKEVTLTTADGDVAVTYEVMGESLDIVIEGGKITITPSVHAKTTLKATFTCGDYSTFDFFTLETIAMTEEEMVQYEADRFDFPLLASAGVQEGFTNKGNTFVNVKVTYVGADEAGAALVTMSGDSLYLKPVDESTKIHMNVTFSIGEGDSAYSVTLENIETTIQPSTFVTYERITAPEEGKEYYFGTASDGSGQVGSWMFADGKQTTNGYYLSTTTDITKAVKFTAKATENENEYILMSGGKYVKVTQNYKSDDDHSIVSNIGFTETESEATAFTYTGEGATLAFTFVSKLANTQNKYDTYALVQNYTNLQVYIAVKDSGHFNNSNYSQYQLVVVTEDNTDTQGRATKVANAINLAKSVTEDYALPTTSKLYNDVIISWALKEAVEGQAVEDNTLTITRGETNVTVTLVATATCGLKTATKEFTVTVEANAKVVDIATLVTTAMAAEDGATLEGQYEVTGYVKAVTGAWNDSFGNMTVTISDATGAEVSLFRTTQKMTVGDVVHVVGYVQKYVSGDKTTIQFKQGHTIKEWVECTLVTPTELYNMFIGGNATDEQKEVNYLIVAPVTKVVNGISGTYTTGNYFVSDATAAVEAYKLGQADGKTDVVSKVKANTVIVFYGKATVFGKTVETTPSTLVSMYQPEEPTYTTTALADVMTKVDASEAVEDLYVALTVEFIYENGETCDIIVSNGGKYAYINLPAGAKTVVGAKLVAKLASASKDAGGYVLTAKELASSLAQSTVILDKAIETEFAGLTPSYNKVAINDVAVANNVAKLSDTVNVVFYNDLTFAAPLTIEAGSYNFTGYVLKATDSTLVFYVLSYEKALPKVVLTQESMGYTPGNNVSYATTTPGSFEVKGVTFEYKNSVGAFGNGIQFKKSTNGTLYNTTALSSDITSIVLFIGSSTGAGVAGGTAYPENWKVEVANNADFTDAVTLTGTKDGSYITYAIESGSYQYVRVTNTSTYACYINTLTINLAVTE